MPSAPLSALSQKDDAGDSVAPEVGDVVDFGKATAKVTAINGDNADFVIQSVNGVPVKCGESGGDAADEDDGPDEAIENPATGEPMDSDGAALMNAAARQDRKNGRA